MLAEGDALAPGTRLFEFEIEQVLGAGGFGVTYLARDLSSLDAWRAVKEYLPRDWGARQGDGTIGPRTGADAEDYQWGLERFLDEARILDRFRHQHIVRVYRVFEERGTAYMMMEYVEGRTLRAEVKETGLLSEARVRNLLEALTDGLSTVHAEEGMLHRDIKPENVMVRPDGTPVLIDFGAARQAMGLHSRTLTGVLTPRYAPIEQYPPGRNQGPWTDIYSLGALAYWAVSGQEPDVATERVQEDGVPSLSSVAAGRVSDELAAAVDAALRVYPRDRPQSLDEWRGLLRRPGSARERHQWRTGPETADDVQDRPQRLKEWREWLRRLWSPAVGPRRRWLVGAAAAGLAVAVLVQALSDRWNGTRPPDVAPELVTPTVARAVPSNAAGASANDPVASALDSEEAETAETSPAAVEMALRLDRSARREIQRGLAASGFDPGRPDGMFGPGTRGALRRWQSARGVLPTSYLTEANASALRAAAPPPPTPAGTTPGTTPPTPVSGPSPRRRRYSGAEEGDQRRATVSPGRAGRTRPGRRHSRGGHRS